MLMQKEVVDAKHFRRFILFSRIEFVEDCFYSVCIVRESFVLNNWVRLHSVAPRRTIKASTVDLELWTQCDSIIDTTVQAVLH